MFQGSICALITPFHDGKVDEKRYAAFVDWQIGEGTEAVVPCGTTGESPTLSHAEHMRVVEICIGVAKGRVPVIAGTGSNSTDEAIMLTAEEIETFGLVLVSCFPTPLGSMAIYDFTVEVEKHVEGRVAQLRHGI